MQISVFIVKVLCLALQYKKVNMRCQEDLALVLALLLLALELVAQLRDETGATSLATPGVVLTHQCYAKNKKNN